jgi:hypothetical protein
VVLGSEEELSVRAPLFGWCQVGLLKQHNVKLQLNGPQVHELPHLGCAVPGREEPPHVVRRHPKDGGTRTVRVGLSHWWWAGGPPPGSGSLGFVGWGWLLGLEGGLGVSRGVAVMTSALHTSVG